ncbi:MAG: ATP-dependent Clp protease ATP-binding subunit [Pseudomonadota bacterium]
MDMCSICHRSPAVTRVELVQNGQRRQMELCEQHYRRLMQLQTRPPFPLNAVAWSSARLAAFGRALIAGVGLYSSETFSPASLDCLRKAVKLARGGARSVVGSEHLLLALCDSVSVQTLFDRCGLSLQRVRAALQARLASEGDETSAYEPEFSSHLGRALRQAQLSAREFGPRRVVPGGVMPDRVDPEHLLLGLAAQPDSGAGRLLREQGLSTAALRLVLRRLPGVATLSDPLSRPTPYLEKFSRDLSALARQGRLDPLIGRSREVQATLEILSRRKKNNPLLIGEPGVGKTALVEGLAQRLLEDGVSPVLGGKRVLELNLHALLAGGRDRRGFDAQLQHLLEELVAHQDRLILFIDEVHLLIGADPGVEGGLDLAALFKPALARGELQLIGATTLEAYQAHIEKDSVLERRFQPVPVPEPSVAQTIAILRGLRQRLESHHQVRIRDAALIAAAGLSARYIAQRFLPDKAIDLVDQAAARVRLAGTARQLARQQRRGRGLQRDESTKPGLRVVEVMQESPPTAYAPDVKPEVVRVRDIAEVVSTLTGVPLAELSAGVDDNLLQLEQRLHRRVIGQDGAIKALSDAVRLSRRGLREGREPIASLLFLGPSGVGKTELAKALAEALFGNENAMIHLDMSEYREAHSLSRLIGSPPGILGPDEGGRLTEWVRRRPYSLIVLDELDKASREVIDLLLQVFDEGRLIDGKGLRVDFSHCVIIATSNLGPVTGDPPRHDTALRAERLRALREHFPLAFLNRLDQIIVFETLSRAKMEAIVRQHLTRLTRRMRAQGIVLVPDDSLMRRLAEQACLPECSVHELKRRIRQGLETHLALALLKGEVKKGERWQLFYDAATGIGLRQAAAAAKTPRKGKGPLPA